MVGLKMLLFNLILFTIVSSNTIRHGDPLVIQSSVEGLGFFTAPECAATSFCARGFGLSLSDVSDLFHIRRFSGSGAVRHGDWVRIVHQRSGLVLDACSNPVYVGHKRSEARGQTSGWQITKVDGTSGEIRQGDKVKFRMQYGYYGARHITALAHRGGPKEACNGASDNAWVTWTSNGSNNYKGPHGIANKDNHTFMLHKALQHGSEIAVRSIIPGVGFFKAPNCARRTCDDQEGKFLNLSNSLDKFTVQHSSGASGPIQHNDWVSLVHRNTNLYADACGATIYMGKNGGDSSKWQIQKIDGSAGPIFPGDRFKLKIKDDYAVRYMNIEYYNGGSKVDCEGNLNNAWVTWASDGSENSEEKEMHTFSFETPIGCDQVPFSGLVLDKCGICDGDGSTCEKCEDETHQCNHICENDWKNYKCKCHSGGYKMLEDEATCVDINECETDYHGCAHNCHNTIGSYTCSCLDGFELAEDGKYCNNIAEDSNAFYVVMGDTSNEECLDQYEKESIQSKNTQKELAVACCALDGSEGSRPDCLKAKNYVEASTMCKSKGQRLCTRREIKKGIVKGSECGFDNHLHWTSTPCGKFTWRHVGCFRTRKNHIHLGQPLTGKRLSMNTVTGGFTTADCFLACQGYTYFTASHTGEGGCICGYKYDNYARWGPRGCGTAWSGSFYQIELKSVEGLDLHENNERFDFTEIPRVENENTRELYLTQSKVAVDCPPWGCGDIPQMIAQWKEPETMPYYDASFTLSGTPLPEHNIEILESEPVLDRPLTTVGQFLTIQFSVTNKNKLMLEIQNEDVEVEFVGMWGPECSLEDTFTENTGKMNVGNKWASFDMTREPTSKVEFCVGVLTNIQAGSVKELNVRVHKSTKTREMKWDEKSRDYVKPLCYDGRIYGGFDSRFQGDEVGSKYAGISKGCYMNYALAFGQNRHMCSFHAGSLPGDGDFETNVNTIEFADIIAENRDWVPADEFCSECDLCGVNDSGGIYKFRVHKGHRRRLSDDDIEASMRQKFDYDEITRLADKFGTRSRRKVSVSTRRSLSEVPQNKRRNLMTMEQWCEAAKEYYPRMYAQYCVTEPESEYDDYVYSVQLDALDEYNCDHFKQLAESVQLDSEDSDADVKLISYNHFCNDFKKEKEHIWALGEKGETCLELCTGMGMVTTDTIPNTKTDFESIMISYEHKEGDRAGTELSQPISIKEYCNKDIISSGSSSAPEMKDGYCIWTSIFMNRNFDRDGMRTATNQDRRRFCSCSKTVEN